MKEEILSLSIELFKLMFTSVLGASIVYWFSSKGKKQDVDFQKNKELNIVLSNMLETWRYLNKLNEFITLEEEGGEDYIYPKGLLVVVGIRTGLLDDKCFNELESSIVTLKQYDPIAYNELQGIGKKFEFIKSNCVIPFITIKSTNDHVTNQISRTFLDKLLKDIEEHLIETAALISKETLSKIEKKIEFYLDNNIEDLKKEINNEMYELYILAVPEGNQILNYEEYISQMKKPEAQIEIQKHTDLIATYGIDSLMPFYADNPNILADELLEKINNTQHS